MKQKPGGGGGADFQDVGSQFWDLDFTQWASHDPRSTRLHSVRRSMRPKKHATSQCPKVTGTH